jgi:acetolactate synthase-1/2/3 large subunit
VRKSLEEFVSFGGPAFLEVIIDPHEHVNPMVGPGMGYGDMIVGKYITPRAKKTGKVDSTGSF